MPSYSMPDTNIFAKRPSFNFGLSGSGGPRTGNLLTTNISGPVATSTQLSAGGNSDWLQLFGLLASGGLGLTSLLGYGKAGLGGSSFDPTLTADKAGAIVNSAGVQAYGALGRQSSAAKRNVTSNYYGRGLGSSGAAIGDIAGIDTAAMGAYGGIQAQLQQQLGQYLQYIDNRDMQLAMEQQGRKQETWGTLGDMALTLGALLL